MAEKTHKTLRAINASEFSMLCSEIDKSVEFASILLTVIESSSASLFPMAGGYAIALESLSDIILSEVPQQQLVPIKDKKLACDLRKALKKTLSETCPNLDEETRRPLIARIDNINSKTNMDNLKAPFILLGIDLLEEDIKIIKTRNDLLHGRIPTITFVKPNKVQDDNKILFYTAIRLYTLINLLVLKKIGYNNKVVNFPKIYEAYTGIKLKEGYFRQV